jgi:uncharacterized protein (TIGR02145 family)
MTMRNEKKRAAFLYAALSIATLLALMLSACSENLEETPVAGIPVEQPTVAQNQDSLSTDKPLPVAKDSVVSADSSTLNSNAQVSNSQVVFENVLVIQTYDFLSHVFRNPAYVNSFAKMYELDSVTLDTTGKIFNGSYDKLTRTFLFDSVSVNGPVVLVEICSSEESECLPKKEWEITSGEDLVLRKIVDLRNTQNIVVDANGHLKSYRIARLAQSGMSYELAEEQADRDILDAFGFFKNSFDVDQKENINPSDSIAAIFLSQFIANYFSFLMPSVGKYGSFDSLPDSVRQGWLENLLRGLEYDVLNSEKNALWIPVKSNFIAVLQGLGECTPAKEGTVFETSYKLYNLVCKSGNWGVEKAAPIDSAGMMTDLRDGKKYKTVTYNIAGVSETWLAEDLMFGSSDGNYMFTDAIALDTSIMIQSFEECFEHYLAISTEEVDGSREATAKDSSSSQSICELYQKNKGSVDYERLWPAVDSVVAEKGFFQGVCPDGWHLPSGYEWERLMRYVADTYDNSGYYSSSPRYLETAGFGKVLLPDDIYPGQTKETCYAMKPDSTYRAKGFEDFGALVNYGRFVSDYWDVLPRSAADGQGNIVRVRCVMN